MSVLQFQRIYLLGLPIVIISLLLECMPFGFAQQQPASGLNGGSRATQLPLSGRTLSPGNGNVTVQQSPLVTGSTIETLNSSVQVQGNFSGSVLKAMITETPYALSLEDALKKGLANNLGTVDAGQTVLQAKGLRRIALSSLLPNINGNVQASEQRISLAEYGFSFPKNSPITIPTSPKPFHYYDVRATLSQTILDLTALRNYRAAKATEQAAELTAMDDRDLVVLAVVGSYLQTLSAYARVQAAEAQVKSSQASYQQAVDLFKAGLNAKIDPLRTQVDLQTQQQRLTTQYTNYEKQLLTLKRIIGLPLPQPIVLSDKLVATTQPANPVDMSLDDALKTAMQHRADLKAAQVQVDAATATLSAARAEYLPTLQVNANYGMVGKTVDQGNGVFGVTGALNIPIFQGGHVRGDIDVAMAALNTRQAELSDIKGQVEYDVRNAFLDLQAAIDQVKLAHSNLGLAHETLLQSQDRFGAGVTDSLEVVQSQQAFATANEDFISSTYSYNLAKASLARSLGMAETGILKYLKGSP